MITKVLVADENSAPPAHIYQQLQARLEASTYQLRFVASGAAALACARAEPDLDIVLLSLNLPDTNGLAPLGQLLALLPHGQVVVISTPNNLPTIRVALRSGAFDFLCQPFEMGDLFATIEQTAQHVRQQRAAQLLHLPAILGGQPVAGPSLPGEEAPPVPGPLAVTYQLAQAASPSRFTPQAAKREPAGAGSPPAAVASPADGSVQASWLNQLYALLDAHLDKSDLSVEWVATQLCISRKTLLRRLRHLLNLTPHDVIQQYRLRRGAELLRAGHSVAHVAYAVGFNAPTHFGQRFKQLYHLTPRQFSGSHSFPHQGHLPGASGHAPPHPHPLRDK